MVLLDHLRKTLPGKNFRVDLIGVSDVDYCVELCLMLECTQLLIPPATETRKAESTNL